MRNDKVKRLTMCALIAALSYVGFQFFKFDIPVGTERTAIHLGNAFVVLGALLISGIWGTLAGAIGLTIADLTSGYVTTAPKTFILKMIIGIVVSLVARKMMKISEKTDAKGQSKVALVSSAIALGLNVFLDPIFGYFYKSYIIGVPQDMAATLSKIGSVATLVNAVISTLIVTLAWPAIYSALTKARLLSNSDL